MESYRKGRWESVGSRDLSGTLEKGIDQETLPAVAGKVLEWCFLGIPNRCSATLRNQHFQKWLQMMF